jgi:hypothetical protein
VLYKFDDQGAHGLRVFKTKVFARFAKKENISDLALRAAIARANRGLVDADLGGGVIKQRVARPGEGKSGGYRTVVAFRGERNVFFMYGFAKNDRDNINARELAELRKIAGLLFGLDASGLANALARQELEEVYGDDKILQE